MTNLEGDESDSLVEQVDLAWEDMDLDVCVMDPLDFEPEKVGKIKTLLRCVGIGKSSD